MTNTKKGFTLIELLIVITIIGILAAALLPNILAAPTRARDAARQADINSLVAGIEAMNADAVMSYPSGVVCINDTNFPDLAAYVGGGVIPTDPSDQVITFEGNSCAAGEYFYCEVTAANQNYAVAADLEDDSQGNDDGDATSPVCGGGGSSGLTGTGYQVAVQ